MSLPGRLPAIAQSPPSRCPAVATHAWSWCCATFPQKFGTRKRVGAARMARRAQGERKDRYFQLHHYMLETDAWKALSTPARVVYVQIGSRYNGSNNGRLALSVRDAASECNVAPGTASRALKELVDLGFIQETRHGGLSRKTRIASEWRLTAFKCDLTGALKTCLFMQRGSRARESRVARSRPQASGRKPARLYQSTVASVSNDGTACTKRGSVKRPSVSNDETLKPVLGGAPVSNDDTHIIYHPLPPSEATRADGQTLAAVPGHAREPQT
jgi:hypothetical protein